MPIELKVPEMGESVTQVQVGDWFSPQGNWVEKDAAVVVLESDKATFELPAPVSGTVTRVLKQKGDTAEVGEVIGYLEPSEQPAGGKASKDAKPAPAKDTKSAPATKDAKPAAATKDARPSAAPERKDGGETRVMPAAQRALAERGLTSADVTPTGPGGRLLKEDVERQVQPAPKSAPAAPAPAAPAARAATGSREQERVPMSSIRQRIAERLVQAHQQAALLTTFNEIDM